MFSYISSFFGRPEPELSLEEIADILAEDKDCSEDTGCSSLINEETQFREEYNFSTRNGKITGKSENNYIIDDVYEFDPELAEFEIGAQVSYQKHVSEGKIVIYNVTPILSDWDTIQTKQGILSTRVMICKVESREKRTLNLIPGHIKLDLNKSSTEFIPITGDWLELDVKYEVDETSLDLSGKVIEINRVRPLRPHIQGGKITFWDPIDKSGVFNKNTYFNWDSLSCGYVPVVGDQVVAELIESEQNKCSWRALKIIPETVKRRLTDGANTGVKVEERYPGLEVGDIRVDFRKLGESREFTVDVINTNASGGEIFRFLNVELQSDDSQCKILESSASDIVPGQTSNVTLLCTPRNMGSSTELLLLNFTNFSIGKYININVNPNTFQNSNSFYQKPQNLYPKSQFSTENQVIRGQRSNVARFQGARLPDYPVPKKLLDLVLRFPGAADKPDLIEELRVTKRSLFNNLGPLTYEEKFHTLLHLDEIANLICIRQYDQDRTCFIRNNEFLMLEIDNLAERRPSIVLGDRILASDPLRHATEDYEGNVFKVGAKHVYLKFSSMFHDTYKGEDYSVRVVPGRSAYRRQHHAIYLVARNLGKDWLFPTKIMEKSPQIDFYHDPYPRTVPTNQKRRSRPKELIKKINRAKNERDSNSATDEEQAEMATAEGGLKLEWYNSNLNCKQKDAVVNVLKGVCRPLPYVIFGPPGTGKTVTVIETILQIVRLIPESRLLVTAPSNSAADLVALRLIDSGVLKPGDLVRLVSVNYATGDHIPPKLVSFCATASMAKEGTADENVMMRNGITYDCSRTVLGRHKITVATCSSAGALHMTGFPRGHFTHVFVDEAGQAAEPEVMIPLSFLDKSTGQAVLAGDPMQLGPVVLCRIAGDCGLSESFLERLINRFPYVRDIQGFPDTAGYDSRLVTKLLYNYRSLNTILQLFSSLFYNGDLIPTISESDSAESRVLTSLSTILPRTKNGGSPAIVFHGVDGENYQTADSPSWYNPHEAAQVFYYLNEIYRLGLKSENVGIITPYAKQVKEIRQLLRDAEFPLPKVGTVEDFQGQEFDVVLLSTVRSSRDFVACDLEHSLGFVSSPRRLNVAISRPKALLVIIGNPALLRHDTYWRNVIGYCAEKGAYTGCDWSV